MTNSYDHPPLNQIIVEASGFLGFEYCRILEYTTTAIHGVTHRINPNIILKRMGV